MKTIIKPLFFGAVVFLLFYLVGCFMNVSFNISDWTNENREGIAISGLLVTIITMALTAVAQDENKRK